MNKEINIEILDPVWSRAIDQHTKDFLQPVLSYEAFFTKRDRYGRIYKKPYRKNMLNKRNGLFLTGYIERVSEYASVKNYQLNISNPNPIHQTIHVRSPSLQNISLREYQKGLVQLCLQKGRGVIKSPPRSGKTVMAGALINCFPNSRSLFLCHKKDLVWQTEEEFQRFGFSVGVVGAGRHELDKDVTIATHQTFVRYVEEFGTAYDVVIVDECHHISSLSVNYAKILTKLIAPWRIGFTATPPEETSAQRALEGLLGPKIGELEPEEAQRLEVLAKPKIVILKSPEKSSRLKHMSYREAYKAGIMRSRSRNRMIVKKAVEYMDEGMTVLILVTRVPHGFYLKQVFDLLAPDYSVPFVCSDIDADTQREISRLKKRISSSSDKAKRAVKLMQEDLDELQGLRKNVRAMSEKRNELRKALDRGDIRCVVATNIWNEGVNIPNLSCVINAAGGKSETATIQMASRSMTAAPGKEWAYIIDLFDDTHNSFISHFGNRVCLYIEEGWL